MLAVVGLLRLLGGGKGLAIRLVAELIIQHIVAFLLCGQEEALHEIPLLLALHRISRLPEKDWLVLVFGSD